VNRSFGVIRRRGLTTAVAAAAVCVVVLASVLPARAAVELAYFYVTYRTDDVLISWGTGSELTTVGFYIYRTETEYFSREHQLNDGEMIEATQFPQPFGDVYHFVDGDVDPGLIYHYWLEVVDTEGNKVFGPGPRSTPTATSTSTAAGTSTTTATPTRTKTPTPTSTVVPTLIPSFTATGVPTSMPTGTPQSTPALTTPPSASATVVPEQASSPTATTAGVALPTLTVDDAQGGLTPSPASTAVALASEESPGDGGAVVADTGSAAPWWSSLRRHLPAIYPSTILLSISMMSLVGVLLLSLALVLLHRSSL